MTTKSSNNFFELHHDPLSWLCGALRIIFQHAIIFEIAHFIPLRFINDSLLLIALFIFKKLLEIRQEIFNCWSISRFRFNHSRETLQTCWQLLAITDPKSGFDN